MKVIEDVTVEPVTVDEARAHIEHAVYDDSDVDPTDDAMIEGFISAAREHCEQFLGLTLARKTLEVGLSEYPDDSDPIELPFGPVVELLSITTGAGSDDAVWSAEDFQLDDHSSPARLYPVEPWPTVTAAYPNLIRVRYLAGYGVDSDGGQVLPKVVKAAILLMIGHFWKNREATVDKAMAELPLGVESLLRPLRVRLGMS